MADNIPNIVIVSDDTFENEVINSSIPTIVDFWAPWCGPCRSIAPVLEEIAKDYPDQIRIAKVDVDSNKKYATDLGVTAIPTIFFYKNGKIVDQQVGFQGKSKLEDKIKDFLGA